MSGSAGGNRITRASVASTTDNYINRILKKFPAFKSAKISGSYNTSAKEDFGDIDLIVNLKSTDKKNTKLELAKFLSALPDDVIVPFKSEKYKGKKYLNTGEIITILYPIEGQPDQYVQIDNIVSISDDEAEFKKEFLDYPAEIQGLLLGLAKVICLEEDPKSIFTRMGISNIPELEANQEYEFNLSSAGLTLRIVTLDNFKEVDRTDVWKTSNWSNIKKLFTNYKIDGKFEDLLNDISSKVKNPRSKNRIKGVFNSMVSIKSGEVGTPKGDNKQKSLDKVNNMLNETNLGRYLVSLLLEQDQPTVALYPGKFKPPHKGHFEVVYKLLNTVDEVIVLISPKTHEGITAQESAQIWNLYKSSLPDGNRVKLKISEITPVKDVYDYIEANPEQTVYAAYGKGEEDRYKNLKKYSNAKVFDAGSTAFENGENISATNFRQALLSKDKEKIKSFIPTGISVDDVLSILNRSLNEYSQGIVNKLTAKFKQENPSLSDDDIKKYINRFDSIKGNLPVDKRDITKYSWNELEQAVASSQSKRIKAGKINDGEPEDANLVYNQNKLRIYVGKTKNACIKYGNGYNFCISSRGDDNMYYDYRYGQQGTPYFVFDDEKSSEQDENGNFIDKTHLLVIFVHEGPEENGEYPIEYYTVTTANNPGENDYFTFYSIENKYPRLKGLKDIFKGVEVDPKEKAEYNLNKKYDALLGYINESYGNIGGKNYLEEFWDKYHFSTIEFANKVVDEFINGKAEVYRFRGVLKPGLEDEYMATAVNQNRLVKVGGKISVEDQKKNFIEEILKQMYEGDKTNHNVADDWDITYEKINSSDDLYKKYFEDVKQLVDKYRNDLSKLRLMKEGLESKPQRLNESQTATIGEFIKYACKDLGIQKLPSRLTLSYDTDAAREKRSFGYFDPNNNQIWVYVKNRNMADILRTLAHELVHRKQDEDGRIDYESGETGSDIENEANAQAGVLLRDYGKVDNGIYEVKKK
jgi:cytidyltransferase-like protein